MFGKLEVHASEVVWRFEPVTFYMGELRGKLILAPHASAKIHLISFVLLGDFEMSSNTISKS